MANKAQIMHLIQRGHAEILHLANSLSEAERVTSGEPDHWAARDELAHMCEWKKHDAELLAFARRGEEPPSGEHYLKVNEVIFEQYRHSSWEEIMALVESAQSEMVAQVEALSEAELQAPDRFEGHQGRPLWRSIAGNSYLHPITHLTGIYLQRGERAYASQLSEEQARLAAELDDSAEWQGITYYNLACYFALLGEKEKALEILEPALKSYPYLVEWSQEDTDLVSLHGKPEFLEMLQRVHAAQA
jgi:hypothetical protein